MSPVVPKGVICTPALERLTNHLEFEGWKTVASVFAKIPEAHASDNE